MLLKELKTLVSVSVFFVIYDFSPLFQFLLATKCRVLIVINIAIKTFALYFPFCVSAPNYLFST
jgi:hypothetical protein